MSAPKAAERFTGQTGIPLGDPPGHLFAEVRANVNAFLLPSPGMAKTPEQCIAAAYAEYLHDYPVYDSSVGKEVDGRARVLLNSVASHLAECCDLFRRGDPAARRALEFLLEERQMSDGVSHLDDLRESLDATAALLRQAADRFGRQVSGSRRRVEIPRLRFIQALRTLPGRPEELTDEQVALLCIAARLSHGVDAGKVPLREPDVNLLGMIEANRVLEYRNAKRLKIRRSRRCRSS